MGKGTNELAEGRGERREGKETVRAAYLVVGKLNAPNALDGCARAASNAQQDQVAALVARDRHAARPERRLVLVVYEQLGDLPQREKVVDGHRLAVPLPCSGVDLHERGSAEKPRRRPAVVGQQKLTIARRQLDAQLALKGRQVRGAERPVGTQEQEVGRLALLGLPKGGQHVREAPSEKDRLLVDVLLTSLVIVALGSLQENAAVGDRVLIAVERRDAAAAVEDRKQLLRYQPLRTAASVDVGYALGGKPLGDLALVAVGRDEIRPQRRDGLGLRDGAPAEEVPVLAGHGVAELSHGPVREAALHEPSPASLTHYPCLASPSYEKGGGSAIR